jgi:putative RecB family exonuclease
MALPLPTSLSPSKVSTFKDCALAFRFSAIDKLPEPPSIPAVKGTTVHRALELLFGAEPSDRTPDLAQECLSEALLEMRSVEEYLGLELDAAAEDLRRRSLRSWSSGTSLEDPRTIRPSGWR